MHILLLALFLLLLGLFFFKIILHSSYILYPVAWIQINFIPYIESQEIQL